VWRNGALERTLDSYSSSIFKVSKSKVSKSKVEFKMKTKFESMEESHILTNGVSTLSTAHFWFRLSAHKLVYNDYEQIYCK